MSEPEPIRRLAGRLARSFLPALLLYGVLAVPTTFHLAGLELDAEGLLSIPIWPASARRCGTPTCAARSSGWPCTITRSI